MAGVKHVTEKQRATHIRSHGWQNALPIAFPRSFFHSSILYSSILLFSYPLYYETYPFSGTPENGR